MAIEADIMNAIVAKLQTVPSLITVNSDRIILSTSDFRDHELPAAQIWDVAQTIEHQRGRILVSWAISIEIIMKSLETGAVTQSDLWNLRRECQLALWDQPNLGLPGVVHLVYNSNITDLHLLEPFYITRLDFDVLYYDDLTGSC